MVSQIGVPLRYAAYAIVTLAVLAAYILLGTEADQPTGPARRGQMQTASLPELSLFESDARREPRRDLFAFASAGAIQEQPAPVFAPQDIQDGIAAREPDLLAGLTVFGIVRHSDTISILLNPGNGLTSVELGERFGPQGALAVQSVEGRNVIVADTVSKKSRVFTLSEE